MRLDYLLSLIKYGATVTDYFEYQFWKKKSGERAKYITMLYSRKIQKFFNKGDKTVFIDKIKFNSIYSSFRSLKSIDLSSDNVNEDTFVDFVKACDRNIIMKPLMGASGHGIYKPDVSTDEKTRNLFGEIRNQKVDYLAEQIFTQTGSLNSVNPASLNTVRMFTLCNGKDVYLMGAGLRIGGGKAIVDNIHAGGMVCELDLETGTVIGPGYNLMGDKFAWHPVTKVLIPGLVVPQWKNVLKIIKKAALINPNLAHSAWDVAVSETEICLIEANEQGNFDLLQSATQRGFKEDYKKALNGEWHKLLKI